MNSLREYIPPDWYVIALIGASSILSACEVQTLNSFSSDRELFSDSQLNFDPNDPNAVRFSAFRAILRQKCVGCHAAFAAYSSTDWVAYGYILPRDPVNSPLYRKLRGANVGGEQNMPPVGALSSTQLAQVWDFAALYATSSLPPPPSGGGSRTERFIAAQAVIATRCASCHSVPPARVGVSTGGSGYAGTSVPFFPTFTSESEFVVSGMVDPGYPDRSWLYRALRTYGDINSMPKTGPPLSAAENDAISKWILGIGLP